MEDCEKVLKYPSDIDALATRFADLPGFVRISSVHGTRPMDIISALPQKVLRNHNGRWMLTSHPTVSTNCHATAEALESIQIDNAAQYLTGWLDSHATKKNVLFNGGLIGFLSYDAKASSQSSLQTGRNDLRTTPLVQVGLYEWAIICDHKAKSCVLFFHARCPESRRVIIQQRLTQKKPHPRPFELQQEFSADQSRETYIHSFTRIQDYIQAGDCYQINYAQRFSATFKGDPWVAFCRIRQATQPPYAAFIRTDHGAVLSFSPEQFLSIQDQKINTAPIKGTRPRGRTPEEDAALRAELAQSIKDRAENLMIVDLLRNDLSLHAQTGSVQVTKLFEIQSFHNVHHLVTSIEALKKPQVSPLTVLWDAFPGGSITGAPKKRAMEIIAELEPHSRSVYCGSIFWCSHNGHLNSNIAIRTLVCEEDNIYCWGGGGVVADSEVEREYQESVSKVAYFMETLEAEFLAPAAEG